jgi:hypothetical protein
LRHFCWLLIEPDGPYPVWAQVMTVLALMGLMLCAWELRNEFCPRLWRCGRAGRRCCRRRCPCFKRKRRDRAPLLPSKADNSSSSNGDSNGTNGTNGTNGHSKTNGHDSSNGSNANDASSATGTSAALVMDEPRKSSRALAATTRITDSPTVLV